MRLAAPWPLLAFRGLTSIELLGLVLHLLRSSTTSVLPYKIVGWTIVGLLVLMLFLSWIRKPLSAYAIACFIPLLPAAFFIGLWLIVLKTAPAWEFVLMCGSFMLLPITLSIQIIRDSATRDYFRSSSTLRG